MGPFSVSGKCGPGPGPGPVLCPPQPRTQALLPQNKGREAGGSLCPFRLILHLKFTATQKEKFSSRSVLIFMWTFLLYICFLIFLTLK